jgi:hypothetical protein
LPFVGDYREPPRFRGQELIIIVEKIDPDRQDELLLILGGDAIRLPSEAAVW